MLTKNADKNGDGSLEHPFSSLEKARNAMRQVRDKDSYDDLRIMIRGGKYEIDSTLQLGGQDSGGEKTPLVVSNYPGEEVIFTGGRDIDMTKAEKVTDEKVLARIPEEARGEVLQIDLTEQGLTGLENVAQTYYTGDDNRSFVGR